PITSSTHNSRMNMFLHLIGDMDGPDGLLLINFSEPADVYRVKFSSAIPTLFISNYLLNKTIELASTHDFNSWYFFVNTNLICRTRKNSGSFYVEINLTDGTKGIYECSYTLGAFNRQLIRLFAV